MRHHAQVAGHRHTLPAPIATLGWTHFTIILVVIAAAVLFTGALLLPY